MKQKREPTVEFLKALQEDIWEEDREVELHYSRKRRRPSKKVMTYKSRRRLHMTEWETILEAAEKHKVACAVFNADFGFRFALYLYEAPEWPIAPGAPVDPAPHILTIGWEHMPLKAYKGMEVEEKDYDDRFRAYWAFFKNLFDTPMNHELLKEYGLERLRRMGHYVY